MSTRDSDASDSLSEVATDRPVPSRSYAPHSLTPFRPLQLPESHSTPAPAPVTQAAPNRTPLIVGGIAVLGLLAFASGALYVLSGGG